MNGISACVGVWDTAILGEVRTTGTRDLTTDMEKLFRHFGLVSPISFITFKRRNCLSF